VGVDAASIPRPPAPAAGFWVAPVVAGHKRLPQPAEIVHGIPMTDFYRSRSRQFGRTSAPTVPHLVQAICDPNDGTSI
jgi:hypothetical protein